MLLLLLRSGVAIGCDGDCIFEGGGGEFVVVGFEAGGLGVGIGVGEDVLVFTGRSSARGACGVLVGCCSTTSSSL